jgi:hypothetical protein
MAGNSQLYELLLRIGVDSEQIPGAIDDLKRLGTAGEEAERGMGATSAGAMSLKSQLVDIGVGLGTGQNPLYILIQQGPQAAEAIDRMGGATVAWNWALGGLSAALPILGGLAAAVALAGTAWVVYEANTQDALLTTDGAARAIRDAATSAEALGTSLSEDAAKGWDKFLGQLDSAVTKLDQVRAGMSAAQVAAAGQVQAMTEAAKPAMLEMGARRAALAQGVAQLASQVPVDPNVDPELNRQNVEMWAADLRKAAGELAAVDAELERQKGLLKEGAKAAKDAADATDALKAAQKAEREAAKAAAEEKRHQTEIDRELKAGATEYDKQIRNEAAAEKLLRDSALAGTSAQNQLAAAHNAKIEALRNAAHLLGDNTMLQAALNGEDKVYLEQLQKINDAERQSHVLKGGASGNGGAGERSAAEAGFTGVGGGVQGGINAAPAWVALLVELVRDLKKWGDESADLHKQIWEGIGNLPKTLAANSADWAREGTVQMGKGAMDFVLGLVDNIGPIIGGILGGLVTGLEESVRQSFRELLGWLTGSAQSEATAAKTKDGHTAKVWEGIYWQNVGYDVANWFDVRNKMNDARFEDPPNAGGTNYVASDGTYRLHRGEEVWNRARVRTARANARTSSARMGYDGTRLYIETDSISEAFTQANQGGRYFGQASP